MIYTQSVAWRSIYAVIPDFKNIRESGVNLNLPTALKSAAIECFNS